MWPVDKIVENYFSEIQRAMEDTRESRSKSDKPMSDEEYVSGLFSWLGGGD